ncbi:hypothetical protein G6F57_017669 [Rhizopus arrhizus]|nr:hypothetical protein G6F57_017669 [Rhizopus arrhizus]
MAASGRVQHGLFTDPDRPGIGLGHVGLLADARFLNRNMPAPGVQPAQHGDLVGALDLNGATRVDADPRAFAHDDRPALRGPVRVQRQVGADALRQPGAQRVFRVQRRRPQRQDVTGLGAGTGRLRGAALEPQHRHGDVDLRAICHGQPLEGPSRNASASSGSDGPPSTMRPPLETDNVPPPVTP